MVASPATVRANLALKDLLRFFSRKLELEEAA
jgi:hypothetical protein